MFFIQSTQYRVYFTLVHLNSDAIFSLEILALCLDAIKFIVEK